MTAHYLAAAWRNLRRSPIAFLANVATLSIGFVCFVAAYALVGFWDRAEQHFANAGRTFVVTSEWRFIDVADGAAFESGRLPRTTPWLGPYLEADYPELEAVARVAPLGPSVPVHADDRALRLRTFSADAEFLEIFDLPLAAGAASALAEPRSVVLTADAAQRLFGDGPALGRRIRVGDRVEGTVRGVVGEIPEPSHLGGSLAAPLSFEVLTSRDFYDDALAEFFGADLSQVAEDWFNGEDTTYVLLPADGSLTAAALREALPSFAARHVPAEQLERAAFELGLVPVGDLLGMAVDDALFLPEAGVSIATILLAIGVLVLAVACVNFANLATARATARTREVGMRKTVGAKSKQVVAQHLLEAGLLTGIALAVSLALIGWSSPALERAAGIDLRLALFADADSWLSLLVLLVVVTLAAGAYPALALSRVRPVTALGIGTRNVGSRVLATTLVAAQFAAAAFLLVTVTVVNLQNRNLQRIGLGVADVPHVVIENPERVTGLDQGTLRRQLLRLPQVRAATAMERRPWTLPGLAPLASSPSESAVERTALVYVVGDAFFETMDIELVAGRAFDPRRAEDVSAVGRAQAGPQNVVIARALTEELGFATPADAVGEYLYIPTGGAGERPNRIIGVVEDKALSLSSRHGPRPGFYLFNRDLPFHVVAISPDDVSGALEAIDALWQRLVPSMPPQRRFLDEYFNDAYAAFERVSQAVTMLTAAALLIATVGLFAMALIVLARRTHEIGVRKTLGASSSSVMLMLVKSFSKPILLANLVAWPLAYLAVRAYLNVFVNPITLTPWPFVLCLAVCVTIVLAAVGGRAWPVARMRPAKVLRDE